MASRLRFALKGMLCFAPKGMLSFAMTLILLLIMLAAPCAARASSAIEKAYKQELALLNAEKKELLARTAALEKRSQQDADKLRKAVMELSEQVTSLRIENDVLDQQITNNSEVVIVNSDRQALLANILDQAVSTLRRHGITVPDSSEDPRPLVKQLFAQGCELAERLGKLRVEQGHYFAVNGTAREALILKLSQVAATSLGADGGGALVPAGADALKVLHPEASQPARAFVFGQGPALVPMFLFDPLERGELHAHEERSLKESFRAGGFVMWPILALAVVALLIMLERLLVLRRVHTNAARLMSRVGQFISRGKWGDAAQACYETPGAVARVLGTILRHREQPRSQLNDLVNESILAERPTLERLLPALNVIAAVAPLLGLLGTVTGMIGTFQLITEHGTGDPRMLSGGISEALLTTQFGLIVAIPALLVHSLLSSRVDHVLSDMETNALSLLNQMHCEHCDLLKCDGCRGTKNGEQHCPNLNSMEVSPLLPAEQQLQRMRPEQQDAEDDLV